jgi:hypothetical protein
VLPRGLRVGVVTSSPGAFKVRTHAELSSLDFVSVLFFDTPALTTTDPPLAPVARALSATPDSVASVPAPAPRPTAANEPLLTDGAIKQVGAAGAASPAGGEAEAQQ